MRNLKKILALVLALVMSLSLMATAGAASFPDVADDNAYKTAIEVLNGVKVLQGYDEGARFEPKGAITRAEAAAVIYRIATGDVNDTQKDIYTAWNGAGKLSDVSGWYAGYVNYCCNAGYIKGYPNGTFQAQNNVTGYEVLAMVLRAMGYGRNGEFSGSQWAITVGSLAQTLGITKNIKETLGEPATREMVAEIVFRAIFCETQMYNALHLYEGTGTNLAANLSLEEVEGVVIANEYAHLEGTKTLADGKTLVRDEKNEKDYTINYGTTLDDMGESRLIYIQSKTNVISLADSGKNAKAESTDAEKVDDILSRASISEGDAEKFLNFDKAFKRDSAYKIKYVLKADTANEINGVPIADVEKRIDDAAGEDRAKIVGNTVEVTIVKRNPITDVDMDYMERIFGKADKKSNNYVDGEVYVGTQSNDDISDVNSDNKYSWESFCEEFIIETEDDAAVSKNDNGNWLKVIDNDADGVADYIFKVIYTVAQVTRVKDEAVTLDTKNHTLSSDRGVTCSIDAINNLTDEKVVSADDLVADDIVYYAVIENKAQTYKAAMETATFKDVSRNGKIAVTSDGTEWTQSDVCEHIEDEAFFHDVRNLAGKVSYDCYFDRGGYLAAFVKTDKVGDFKLITDGWFNAQKSRVDEYAVNAYNDAESKLEVVDITKYGDLFVASAKVLNNGWNGLKYLGGTQGGDDENDTAVTGILGANSGAALNGDNVVTTAGPTHTQHDVINTTVAAITADGTILPVHDASVTGRYNHEMIDLDSLTKVPTMAAVEGTVYTTTDNSDTAYNDVARDRSGNPWNKVQVRALDTTIYYVVWGTHTSTGTNAKVLSFVGYDNAPNMTKLAGLVEDIYCVGTRRAADNDTDDVTYSADVVVIELNDVYPDEGEAFFVVDNDWRKTDIGDYRVDGIDSKGAKVEDMRVTGFDWRNDRFAYTGSGIANVKQITPGLYWRYPTATEGTYTLEPMDGADIAKYFSVGTVVEESWTSGTETSPYIVMRSWNQDTLDVYRNNAAGILADSVEKQYKITGAALYTLAYGGNDYDEYAAELEQADLQDVVDRQVDDYVVDKRDQSDDRSRDTWFMDGNNIHYYNRNKVLVFHNDSKAAVWAVSLANVVDNGDNWEDMDLAFDIWRTIVGKVPAILDDYKITVQDNAGVVDTDEFVIANEKNDQVLFEKGILYTSDKDNNRFTIRAPKGWTFDTTTPVVGTGVNCTVMYSKSADGKTLSVIVDGAKDNSVIKVNLTADPSANVAVKMDKDSTDVKIVSPTTITYNAEMNGKTITLDRKAGAWGANDQIVVESVTCNGVELRYNTSNAGRTITIGSAGQIKGDIVVTASLLDMDGKRIVDVDATGGTGTMALADAEPTVIYAEIVSAKASTGEVVVLRDGGKDGYNDGFYRYVIDETATLTLTIFVEDGADVENPTVYGEDGAATISGKVITIAPATGANQKVVITDPAKVADKSDAKLVTAVKLDGETADIAGTPGATPAAAVPAAATAVEAGTKVTVTVSEHAAADMWFCAGDSALTTGNNTFDGTVTESGKIIVRVTAEDKSVQYYVIAVTVGGTPTGDVKTEEKHESELPKANEVTETDYDLEGAGLAGEDADENLDLTTLEVVGGFTGIVEENVEVNKTTKKVESTVQYPAGQIPVAAKIPADSNIESIEFEKVEPVGGYALSKTRGAVELVTWKMIITLKAEAVKTITVGEGEAAEEKTVVAAELKFDVVLVTVEDPEITALKAAIAEATPVAAVTAETATNKQNFYPGATKLDVRVDETNSMLYVDRNSLTLVKETSELSENETKKLINWFEGGTAFDAITIEEGKPIQITNSKSEKVIFDATKDAHTVTTDESGTTHTYPSILFDIFVDENDRVLGGKGTTGVYFILFKTTEGNTTWYLAQVDGATEEVLWENESESGDTTPAWGITIVDHEVWTAATAE